jgi:hypothetical protein
MNNKKTEENMYIFPVINLHNNNNNDNKNIIIIGTLLKYQAKGKRSSRIQLNGKFPNKIESREEILTN